MTNSPKTHKVHFLFAAISDVLIDSLFLFTPWATQNLKNVKSPSISYRHIPFYFVIWEFLAMFLSNVENYSVLGGNS